MEKKRYIQPRIECWPLHTAHMLAASGDELDFPWSGKLPGDAGPDEIDDFSTIDTF